MGVLLSSSLVAAMSEEDAETTSTRLWEGLPDDGWEAIFNHLDNPNLEQVSLVSKRFLAISNACRTTFNIRRFVTAASPLIISNRFPNIKSLNVDLDDDSDMDVFIRQLAPSSLPLQTLHFSHLYHFRVDAMRLLGRCMRRTLRTLTFAHLLRVTQNDLLVIADEFSYLRRLGFEGSGQWDPITDETMLAFSRKLVSLVSLTFFVVALRSITPKSIKYLSSNCPHLTELNVRFFEESRKIDIGVFSLFRSLSSLHLGNFTMSGSGLLHLAQAGLKLQKLALECVTDRYNQAKVHCPALCEFLKSCKFLRHLKMVGIDFSPCEFGTSMPQKIQEIDIEYSRNLPDNTLLELLKSCPNLERLRMEPSFATTVPQDLLNLPTHYHLQHLSLKAKFGVNKEHSLSDEILLAICSVCSNLKSVHIYGICLVTKQGIEAARCCHLNRFNRKGLKLYYP